MGKRWQGSCPFRAATGKRLDRVLDPDNLSIQLDTLIKAARAGGEAGGIKIGKNTKGGNTT